MLNKRISDFHELVWKTAARVGNSAPKVVDEILRRAFPATTNAASDEGADKILRKGAISEVTRILKDTTDPNGQGDFADIDPAFHPLVKPLRSRTYYVESAGEYVSVPMLIADPALLDDARRYMRRKGEECIAEADRLDELFAAVTGSGQ